MRSRTFGWDRSCCAAVAALSLVPSAAPMRYWGSQRAGRRSPAVDAPAVQFQLVPLAGSAGGPLQAPAGDVQMWGGPASGGKQGACPRPRALAALAACHVSDRHSLSLPLQA